jgi:hypothetical protein
MGYTHYWQFDFNKGGTAAENEARYQRALKQCVKVVQTYSKQFGGLAGFTAHAKVNLYGGLQVNGSARVGACEPLFFLEHLKQNEVWAFCKTCRLPYDTVVTACLIILQKYLGDVIQVSSDGNAENWADGLTLARQVTGLKSLKIPSQIERKAA